MSAPRFKRPQAAAGHEPAQRQKPAHPGLRFLLVDDHALVRDGLRQLLSHDFPHSTFGEATSARAALELARQERWDVALLDLSLPDKSGFEVLQELHAFQPKAKILILTMHPEDQYAVRVLKAGASGYLTKDSASAEVVAAVNKVLGGGKYVSPGLAEKLVLGLNDPGDKPLHETLSDREYQVLRMLGSGRTIKEISFDLSLSVKTVSTYRTRVMNKLRLENTAELIRYALEHKLAN